METATLIQEKAEKTSTKKKFPQRKQWDYIATLEEDEELGKLKTIRKAITQSQEEFEKGKGIPVTSIFFKKLREEAKTRFLQPQ